MMDLDGAWHWYETTRAHLEWFARLGRKHRDQFPADRFDPGGVIDASLVEIRKRGFSRILEIFKGMDAGLVEEVNQVRRSRNWVALGRQKTPRSLG